VAIRPPFKGAFFLRFAERPAFLRALGVRFSGSGWRSVARSNGGRSNQRL